MAPSTNIICGKIKTDGFSFDEKGFVKSSPSETEINFL